MRKILRNSLGLIAQLTLLLQVGLAAFTGQIEMSNQEIEATGVTYKFSLRFTRQVPAGGKIVIRFPADFVTQFTVPSCTAVSGFSTKSATPIPLTCTYISSVRLLTLSSGFPTDNFTEIIFNVNGVTNPKYAIATDYFSVDSYSLSGGEFIPLETSSASINVTPTAGALLNESMSLSDSTVGAYSSLTVSLKTVHAIQKDGLIEIDFPKWNFFARDPSQLESFVATATSPGTVPCNAVSGLDLTSGTTVGCIFIHGDTIDTLKVIFDGYLSSSVPPATSISFKVSGVRAPPTTASITGFSFRTESKTGQIIDKSNSPNTISLKADKVAKSQSSNMEVTSDDPSINQESTLTLRVQTLNPLQTDSNIQFTFPADFGLNKIVTITPKGSALYPTVTWTFDQTTRLLKIEKFNSGYLAPLEFIYFQVATVINPSTTGPTASFAYKISDPINNPIEDATSGITFSASAGGFASIKIDVDNKVINYNDASYTFTLKPQDVFTATAVLKIVLPTQIYVASSCQVIGGSSGIVQVGSSGLGPATEVEVRFNRILYIRNAFPKGLPELDSFYITLSNFRNPSTTQATDSFQFKIFYVENTNEVSVYSGTKQTFKASPSTGITMAIPNSNSYKTGEIVKLTISATMDPENLIEKQAYLKVKIPKDYYIANFDRTASTCTRISGFSDEINCDFAPFNRYTDLAMYLYVRGGFDSQTFDAVTKREFSFSIDQIKNPFTTRQPGGFGMEVFDRLGGKMYIAEDTLPQFMGPSPFAFAFVESNSNLNGAYSRYVVTLTLSVDTNQSDQLYIIYPEEIQGDTKEVCKGVTNLAPALPCYFAKGQRIVGLLGDNSLDRSPHKIGSTIQVEIGNLKNPISLKQSSSFRIFTADTEGYQTNIVNAGVTITNSASGQITITKVESNPQLGEPAMLKITLKTTNAIPSSASLVLTLPPNVQVERSKVLMLVNGVRTSPSVNTVVKQLTVKSMPREGDTAFTIEILDGVKNPTIGPYNYDYLQIEFRDSDGYSIDKLSSNEVVIAVQCSANCATCSGSLSTCTSCSSIQSKLFFLKDKQCLEECGKGFFENQSGYICSPCADPCLECSTAATACTLCNPLQKDKKIYADPATATCYAECPARTYLDVSSTTCMPCKTPCYTCSSANTCTSCDRTDLLNPFTFFLSAKNQCLKECPSTSVATPSKQCDACISPCETCESLPGNCRTCIEGTFFHKNSECVKVCPSFYYADTDQRKCIFFGELSIPVPFSIVAIILSFGVGISTFVKGANKEGRELEGTAFFTTMLALIDMLLRINWAVLAYYVWQKSYYITFGCTCGLIAISLFINIYLWRRYFYSKYGYEDKDKLFSAYFNKYSVTANVIIFLSYLLSFQGIRLTYSRFLGKQKFMARFSQRRRYYRLIGRLSILETLFLYPLALALNIYSLVVFITDRKEMQYWLNIDSLALVSYCLILIIIVLTQREKIVNQKVYFQFSELFSCSGDLEEEEEVEEQVALDEGLPSQREYGSMVNEPEDPVEVHSAFGHDDLLKIKMYQYEQRYGSQDGQDGAHRRNTSQIQDIRPVSVIDYQEYRKLEDKRDRIMLKKLLYERKKVTDETQVVILNEELNLYQRNKNDLANQLDALRKQLNALQNDIVTVDKTRMQEMHKVEQEKRRDIIKRAGRDVPYQSHSGATSVSRSKSQLTKSNHTQVSKSPRDPPTNANRRAKRGGKRMAQAKSPRQQSDNASRRRQEQAMATVQHPVNDQSMTLQRSPEIFQANLNMSEPRTLSDQVTRTVSEHFRPGIAQAALDMQLALEHQMSTEVASDIRKPMFGRSVENAETERTPGQQYPFIRRTQDTTSPQEPLQTEVVEDLPLQRPIDTLVSYEVNERVENATIQRGPEDDGNMESFGRPKSSNTGPNGPDDDDDDSVW